MQKLSPSNLFCISCQVYISPIFGHYPKPFPRTQFAFLDRLSHHYPLSFPILQSSLFLHGLHCGWLVRTFGFFLNRWLLLVSGFQGDGFLFIRVQLAIKGWFLEVDRFPPLHRDIYSYSFCPFQLSFMALEDESWATQTMKSLQFSIIEPKGWVYQQISEHRCESSNKKSNYVRSKQLLRDEITPSVTQSTPLNKDAHYISIKSTLSSFVTTLHSHILLPRNDTLQMGYFF